MIFNGVFNDLSADQIVAIMSCFVFQEKGEETPKLSEELAGPLRQMQVCLFTANEKVGFHQYEFET